MQTLLQSQVSEFEKARIRLSPNVPILPRTKSAFLNTPRIRFIERFKPSIGAAWVDAASDKGAIEIINSDRSLIISGDDETVSTASQPSLVWLMLDLLRIECGMVVYEIETGTGWSTALAGQLVGHDGAVYSSEIEEMLAHQATLRMIRFGMPQVIIKCTAGDFEWADRYADRIIYTASTFSPHESTIARSTEQCNAVFVFQRIGLADAIVSANRHRDSFVSDKIVPCFFLSMRKNTGDLRADDDQKTATVSHKLIDWNLSGTFSVSDFVHWLGLSWNTLSGSSKLTFRRERYHSLILANFNSGYLRLSSNNIEVVGDFDDVDIVRLWWHQWVAAGAPSVLDYRLTISKPPRGAPLPRRTELRNDWHFSWIRVN